MELYPALALGALLRHSGCGMNLKMAKRTIVVTALVGVLCAVVFCAEVAMLSLNDVEESVRASGDGSASTRVSGVHLSRTHGIYITYAVESHEQLRLAHWRLRPFREIVVSK